MGRKVWKISTYDKNSASVLARKCGTDDFAVLLLQSRGITKAQDIEAFISSKYEELSSPFLLKDMEKAVERIKKAIEYGEPIHVFGDYDADGVTATALLTSYLEAAGAYVSCSIPSRLNEGYGLSPETARKIAKSGAKLVITVDNGIASFEEAEIFASCGIDFIVTDHHQVGESLPGAYAVIDPHREDDTSPEENLAGVGVALKLAAALEDGDYYSVLDDFGDLAAIGTIADIVPLTGENRIIVSRGLEVIMNSFRPGLLALIEEAGLGGEISASGVAFGIAPRINAAGRMGSAETALELLLCEDEARVQELIKEISFNNTLRQKTESDISEEIEEFLNKNPDVRNDSVLVVSGKDWHPGVIGIAASRLVDRYGRPAIVISEEEGVSRGSCRSIEGFSLYEALKFCSDDLVQFGGHTLAAGFSIEKEKIDIFRKRINEYASTLPEFYPSLTVDLKLNPAALTTDILDSLELLEPYGAGNPSPVFGLFGMRISGIKPIGSNKHLRVNLSKGNVSLPAVYFGQTAESFPYDVGDEADFAVKIEKNEYRGEIRLSIQIKDIRPVGENDIAMFKSLYLYRKNLRGEALTAEEKRILCPDRNTLGSVYRFIKEHKKWNFSEEILCMRLGIPYDRAGCVKICLDALTSVGILTKYGEEYTLSDFSGKADLGSCQLLKSLGYVN